MTEPLPGMAKLPAGCTAVQFGLKTYVADPSAAIIPGDRVAMSGEAQIGHHPPGPIDAIGYYFPKPELTAQGIVRYKFHNNPGGNFHTLASPPWRITKVIGLLLPSHGSGKNSPRKPRKG